MSIDVTDILRATDLLGSASAADLEAIAAASRPRTFRRGQILFSAGDPGDTVIVVISGRVKVVVRSADGGELTLTVIGPGGVIGEVSAADGGPRSADAEVLEDCRLLFVPREVIQDLCGRVPSVAQTLANSVAALLRRLTEDASDLVFLDLPRRVAKVLLSQPRGDDGYHQAENDAGGTSTPGRRCPAERQRRAARLRTTWLDRGARPDRDGEAGSSAKPIRW